ncbi:NADP-dependent malic enzyme-like [Limulus polyphemus]|uniref:Malic enzyme n=1 Tax=Limulus polyphemus TaxID=6850 RepID=A0ABM1TMB1_LIMPO|nr:NADP-dependent malic enzyme-like [Limulus polyphemus]
MGQSNEKFYCECRSKKDKNKNGGQTKKLLMKSSEYLYNPRVCKGLAVSTREREEMELRGILPPAVRCRNLQVKAVIQNLDRFEENLSKYIYLRNLQDFDEELFYKVMMEHTEKLMPIVYTPTVGLACIKYSTIFHRPRGIFLTVHDGGRIHHILGNWPERNVKAIVVTDGERILGLGDLGANGMGIPVGKLALYTALAGIPPELTLPVTIDFGTNNQKLIEDPFYIGLRQKRVKGPEYNDLMDEFMEAVVQRYGRSCLIQFEDFGNHNAFRLLEKYKPNYCTFNDDIQGTASVAVAGILASLKITGLKLAQNIFLFQGAGEAALGTANLLVMAMEQDGVQSEEAMKKIWLIDSKGLIVKNRPTGGITEHKARFAKDYQNLTSLEEIVKSIKPTVLIGASAQRGVFTENVLQTMANNHKQPVIFALSNPTDKAECTASDAYIHTEGRCVFASGSPFEPVTINEKTHYPGQGNNAYIFPGVAFAIMACGVHYVSDEVFLVSAKALADQVRKEHLAEGRVYPPLKKIHDVSFNIAIKLTQYFYAEDFATRRPEPHDKIAFLRSKQYNYARPLSIKLGRHPY